MIWYRDHPISITLCLFRAYTHLSTLKLTLIGMRGQDKRHEWLCLMNDYKIDSNLYDL